MKLEKILLSLDVKLLVAFLVMAKGESHLFHLFTLKQPLLPLNQSLEALWVIWGTITQAISEANVSAQNIVGGLSEFISKFQVSLLEALCS